MRVPVSPHPCQHLLFLGFDNHHHPNVWNGKLLDLNDWLCVKSWEGQEVRKKRRMTPGFAIWPTKWMRIHRLSWETWGWFFTRKNLPLSHWDWGFCGTSWFNIRVCGSGRVSAADWKSPAYDMKSRARTEFRKYGIQQKRGSPEQKPGGPYSLGTWK